MLKQVQPVLPTKNVQLAVEYYVERLGFTLAFHATEHPAYAVIIRDEVEIHLQWHDPSEWTKTDRPMLRFFVTEIEKLYDEFSKKQVFHGRTALRETPWGTREFAFFDLDMNGLTFYVNL